MLPPIENVLLQLHTAPLCLEALLDDLKDNSGALDLLLTRCDLIETVIFHELSHLLHYLKLRNHLFLVNLDHVFVGVVGRPLAFGPGLRNVSIFVV